jgi:hypothetical protein
VGVNASSLGGDATDPSAGIRFFLDGLRRWTVRKNSNGEGGGDTGSDFDIVSFSDAGAQKAVVFTCTRSTSACSFIGSLGSTKACAATYTRTAPNLCWKTTYPTLGALTNNVCTAVGLPSSDAKMVWVDVNISTTSGNAVAMRNATASAYSDAGCSTLLDQQPYSTQEFVATAGSVSLGQIMARLRVPGTASFWIKTTGSSAPGFPVYAIVGYGD